MVEAIMRNTLLEETAPVLPVASFCSDEHARACARLFARAGVPVLEVALRHPGAWEHLAICRELMPGARVGVGTVRAAGELERASRSADFAVSPGLSLELCRIAADLGVEYVPGVWSASEVMAAASIGLDRLKFFPAVAGSTDVLAALEGPFPDVRFCPTGGVHSGNYGDYLALANVSCVGGSWVVPSLEEIEARRHVWLERLGNLYRLGSAQ